MLLLAIACARSPERALVEDAAAALGGRGRLTGVTTLVIEGEGESFFLGEDPAPSGPLPRFTASFRRVFDWGARRLRWEEVRTPAFPTGNPAARQLIVAQDGDVAFDVLPDGKAVRLADHVGVERRALLWHDPFGIVRAALAEGAALANTRSEGRHDAVDVRTADGDAIVLHVDRSTALPAKVTSRAAHPFLGDVVVETEFAEYREAGGLMRPSQIVSRLDGVTLAVMRVAVNTFDAPTGRIELPSILRAAPGGPPTTIEVEAVDEGIWHLTGGTHHSVVAALPDQVVLIEAPLDEARATAVIARARELVPDRPLTRLVVTHHHFDHSAGVRTAVSEGLTIVARDPGAFYASVVARPHTRAPDALARRPRPLRLERVGEPLVLGAGRRRIEIYPITGSEYADTLLMVYFPAGKLLVEADVYTPPEPFSGRRFLYPFAPHLVESIRARKLQVERVVPLHGPIVPFGDLLAAAAPPAAPPADVP